MDERILYNNAYDGKNNNYNYHCSELSLGIFS